ncbi:MAG: hypothetical protein FVQ82_17015 [Planctomycetes bacterium]|nr:hypothetical protein [Planctomycetota bacterium]
MKTGLKDYTNEFVQRMPKYALKRLGGKRWTTVDSSLVPLSDFRLREHLRGKSAVGCIGRWYPGHAVFDIDNKDIEFVYEVQDKLGLNDQNSLLCSSESPDSYHLIFRPVYRKKPPTLRLLNEVMNPFAKAQGIEAYPTAEKTCRLPFGPSQMILNEGGEWIDKWQKKLYWYNKLDEYDLSAVPCCTHDLEFEYPQSKGKVSAYREGKEYFEHGLQGPSSREQGQYHVIYYLWRKNVPLSTTIETVWHWIKTKHNGYSKDITSNPREVKKHIERQAKIIYSRYDLPDDTHNLYVGFVTKADLPAILHHMDGSLPKSRTLFNIVKYCYPRRLRRRITVHSDLLQEWSSKGTYTKRLRELHSMGLVKRGDGYVVGKKSKDLVLKWKYKSPTKAVLIDERSPDTLDETIKACMTQEETRTLLKQAGVDGRNIGHWMRVIYEGDVIKLGNI